MKNIVTKLFICAVLVMAMLCSATTVYGIVPVETDRESSLTLRYQHGDRMFEGLDIRTYRIAEVSADGTYELWGAFKDHPISIYGVTTQAEWKTVCATLSAYASADNVEPDLSLTTDANGTVKFEGILPGMYLTMSVRVEDEGEVTIFESFITAVPHPSEDGEHNYDVTAYPKCKFYSPQGDELEYKIVKQWKDNGNTGQRPEYIEVDILCDGKVQSSEKLSAQNNWSYSWTAPDDGKKWQAVERNVPDGYTVSVAENGNTIIVTNTYETNKDDVPQTGDTFVLWYYALPISLSGVLVIILALWRKRKDA